MRFYKAKYSVKYKDTTIDGDLTVRTKHSRAAKVFMEKMVFKYLFHNLGVKISPEDVYIHSFENDELATLERGVEDFLGLDS